MGTYGGQMNERKQELHSPDGIPEGAYYDPAQYTAGVVQMFDYLRSQIGFRRGTLPRWPMSAFPRLPPKLAKELEQYKLFFL